jgi:hypothetical protein
MAFLILILLIGGAALSILPAATGPAVTDLPGSLDVDAGSILRRYGQPAYSTRHILVYDGTFAEMAARVTFFFAEDRLSAVTFAFPTDGLTPSDLRRDADRVLKRMRVLHGRPVSSTRSEEFKTHSWTAPAGTMVHTVVYSPGRERHIVQVTRTAP